MKTIDCPKCEGVGEVEVTTKSGEVIRDSDGNSFYEGCKRCHSRGWLEVMDNWDCDEIDDRAGQDDYRLER